MLKTTKKMAAVALAGVALTGAVMAPKAAEAAPRQVIVIVAEGLEPQTIEMGSNYLSYVAQVTAEAEEGDVANVPIREMMGVAKKQTPSSGSVQSFKGLLRAAASNGYRTGLVSSGDVAKAAGVFYDIPGDSAAIASTLIKDTKFDFIGGGGRAYFIPQAIPGSLRADAFDASQALRDSGGTPLFNAEAVEDPTANHKGRVLALQAETHMSYALDNDPYQSAGLGELTNLAVQTLAGADGEAPYMLVVHDDSFARAIAAKDTPALLGQYRELNGIVADALVARDSKDDPSAFGIALLATGNGVAPRFTSNDAADRTNSYYIVSRLPRSFEGAGTYLKGADDAKLTAFATEQYKGWKLEPETRSSIVAGTTTPETAIRNSYESAISITYGDAQSQPVLYTVGLDAAGNLASSLMTMTSPKAAR